MARTVTRDVTLRGKKLAEGQKLLLLYPSANRDERVFRDPFTFDAGRQPNEHVAFGFGTHFCLGNSLARLELRVMFEQLLARLPDIELADATEPTLRASNFISGYEQMPVRFTPTSTSGLSRK
jgi:cytochrome P450 family 142 subfamily A polypeptide 1